MTKLLQVRCPGVCFYVLRDGDELYLIDSGFVGGVHFLEQALKSRGWSNLPIRGIILTHGHLDHTLNVQSIVEKSGCWVAVHPLDEAHCRGVYPYRNQAAVCGYLEHMGRTIFNYRTFNIDRWLEEDQVLPIWGGLRVVHLPGHTDGHCGFYSEADQLLFTGDLIASHEFISHRPPNILNSRPDQIQPSLTKALSYELSGIAPNHCDRASYRKHLARLKHMTTMTG